jgi:hypothetical protein
VLLLNVGTIPLESSRVAVLALSSFLECIESQGLFAMNYSLVLIVLFAAKP